MAEVFTFTTERSLGKGAFGEVSKVISKHDQKTYALKMIELKGKMITFDQVLREINFMRELDHPNVVKFVDAFKTQENEAGIQFGILMEYCEQGDLDRFIMNRNGRKFRSVTIHKWMLDLSSAITYIHSKSIMHRGLKPGNIFLDQYTNLKIGDFGVARDVLHSFAGTKIGTTLFMAPETFSGRYHTEADIYSLGCIFICMVSLCRLPKNATGQFVPLPPTITYGLRKMSIIRRCVASRREERPTAQQIQEELESDNYEMLCFNESRSPNSLLSVNKMVAGRKEEKLDSAFVFSSRPLKPGERFCLFVQKVRKPGKCIWIFGFTTTDPASLQKDGVPCEYRDLNTRSESYFQKRELPVALNKKFALWYEENGAVMYEIDGKIVSESPSSIPVSSKLWAVFCLRAEILQVQLIDYD